MLKRFFQGLSPLPVTSLPANGQSTRGQSTDGQFTGDKFTNGQVTDGQSTKAQPTSGSPKMSMPQPIGDADKQRFVKLSDAQGKTQERVCISDWYDSHLSIPHYRQRSVPRPSFAAVTEDDGECSKVDEPKERQKTESQKTENQKTENPESNADNSPLSDQLSDQVHQLTQHIQQQQQLHLVERKLRRTLNFSSITGTTVVETAALFDAAQVSLLRYDSDRQTYQQVVRYCQDQSLAWQPACFLTQSEFPNVLQQLWQGKVLNISATTAEEIAANEYRQWLTRWPGNWLLMPVRKSVNVSELADTSNINTARTDATSYWGLVALSISEQRTWTQNDIATIHSITVELALALQQSQQHQELLIANQELQKLALSDGLTSLANRRRFDEHLADEWQRLARERQPLSLILCDLDHFKRYNDTFGHPAGDRCLIRVARALLSGPQRPADLVARYGGEEFAIILPNTDTHGAWRIAQKIHDSIRALQIDHAPGNEEPYVTVTMGVSTVIPGHENSAQMLVQASDLALYHAKQQGRNRTYVNGHYNTVNTKASKATAENEAELDVMLLDGE